MADGKIVFSTKIDNTQVDKDLKRLERKIRQAEESISKNQNAKLPLESNLKSLNEELEEAEHKAYRAKLMLDRLKDEHGISGDNISEEISAYKKYTKEMQRANKAQADALAKKQNVEAEANQRRENLRDAQARLNELKAEKVAFAQMKEGSTYSDPQKFIDSYSEQDSISEKIESQRKEVSRLKKELNKAYETVEKYEKKWESATGKAIEAAGKADKLEPIIEASRKVQEQNLRVADLQKKRNKTNDSISDYNQKIEDATAELVHNRDEAEELRKQMNSTGHKMQEAFAKARASADKFRKQILKVGASMIMFRVFSAVMQGISQYMGKILKTNEAYTAQLAQLKAALVTAFQPIYEFILPGLMAIMKVLTSIVMVVANVLSALGGKTLAQSAENAKALNEEADAIDAVGSAAKDAGKSLANFDEINTLSSGSFGSGGSGSGAAASQYDFSEFDTAQYKAKIDELTVYLSGALLAIGAILAFSGANIPLGISLMAAGAIGMAAVVKENWGKMSDELEGAIATVTFLLGGALLAIGAVLAFSGISPVKGIALMAVGIASMVGAAALNWDSIVNSLQGPVGKVVALVSGALLALGAILAFSGVKPTLGITLMAVGAVGLATTAALNWGAVKSMMQGPIGKVFALVSGALLVLGAVLAFSGAAVPLGIALMVLGAAGLATTAALNWNAIQSALKGPVGTVAAIASGALLALGLLLAFSGANLPLGIGMIIAGGAGLASMASINWNSIRDHLKAAWEGIKSWFNSNVAPKLTLSYWSNKWSNVSAGLKQSFKNGINGAITLFNQFISWVNSKMRFSWGNKYLMGRKIISAGSIQLVTIPQIPYLAQGAVLPPNKPFMAMVGDQKNGTNVEAPLTTIQEALANVLAQQGTGDIRITFTGDLAQLGRVLKPVIEKENNRVGSSLAKGVT